MTKIAGSNKKLGVSAAAGPILLAWVGKGLPDSPHVGRKMPKVMSRGTGSRGSRKVEVVIHHYLDSILKALKDAGHSTAGFGQVVAAYMAESETVTLAEIKKLISDVAAAFDRCEARQYPR